jgi:uracil-DNA glycosylase
MSDKDLSRLKSRSDHPNVQIAAYICGRVLQDQVDDLSHSVLVTSANLAALLAWDRGVDLSDLDSVRFNVFRPGAGPPHLEIERGGDSVSVPVIDRSFSLEEPWGGFYRISKVVQGTREVEPDTDEASSGEGSARKQDSPEESVPMESVWQNWKNGRSHCQGCPGRHARYPLGGLGDPDSDLMLVAKEPNYKVKENTVRKDMSWPEAKQAMVQDRRSAPNRLWRQMRTVADAAGLDDPTDLYFTNSAKCNYKKDPESEWEDHYEHCRGYLSWELEIVSPKVLLLYGKRAIEAAYETYGLDPPTTVEEVHAQPRQVSGCTLVPLFHWAYAMPPDQHKQDVAEVVRDLT